MAALPFPSSGRWDQEAPYQEVYRSCRSALERTPAASMATSHLAAAQYRSWLVAAAEARVARVPAGSDPQQVSCLRMPSETSSPNDWLAFESPLIRQAAPSGPPRPTDTPAAVHHNRRQSRWREAQAYRTQDDRQLPQMASFDQGRSIYPRIPSHRRRPVSRCRQFPGDRVRSARMVGAPSYGPRVRHLFYPATLPMSSNLRSHDASTGAAALAAALWRCDTVGANVRPPCGAMNRETAQPDRAGPAL
jgi:hypothetical protein